jgi:ABC-type transport system involved in cytochrome bd biosynthesis fused ATPase/permease subunit
LQDEVTRVRTPFIAAVVSAVVLVAFQYAYLPLAGAALLTAMLLGAVVLPLVTIRVESQVAAAAIAVRNRISATVSDLVNRGSEFRVLGLGPYVANALAAQDAERVQVESRSARWAARTSMLSGLATGLAVFSSLAAAVEAHRLGQFNGVMIAVVTLLPWSAGEITATFAQAVSARTRVAAAAARVDALLAQGELVRAAAALRPREEILASPSVLEADRITVTWDGRPAAVDISLTVRRGERLAIVGPTGCGKSSVAAALLRLVEHEGMVMLDAVPVDHLADFRSHVTALMQVTHVFETTLAENLRLANPYVNDEDLIRVIRQVGLGDWFSSLPNGLQTPLGDSGRAMSGGEVQRLGIARVLLSDASFVILDEPTEHLDSATAAAVWQTMNRVFTDRGLIIISHDPEVALDCDQVMVMADGHIAEYGAPDDLNPQGWFHRSAATEL